MKHNIFLVATIMMALMVPQEASAYDFSAVAPTGQTLYFNIVGGEAQVTHQNDEYPNYYTDFPTGALSIPSSVTNNGTTYAVTSIGDFAFYYCSGLTSVIIPNSVNSIGSYVFCNCGGLTTFTIPNSVSSIGYGAFQSCNSLTSVNLPNSLIAIEDYTFENCISLTAINIPDSLTSIGHGVFMGCSSLLSANIPNSVTSIGTHAFHNCSSLIAVNIPDSITTINNATFCNCSNLTSVIIPQSVNTIGWRAFYNCSNLDTVFMMPSAAPSLGSNTFDNNSAGRVFILSGCSYDNYYNNPMWDSYQNNLREPIVNINLYLSVNNYSFGTVNVIPGPGNRNIRCDSSVVIQATNYYGYFDHWSTGSTANPDTIYLVGDSTVTAYFTGLTVTSSDNERGTASHLKIGDHIDKIIATANYGYHFDHWSNGSTANPDTIQFIGDSTVIAFFERNTYHLTAEANDASLGSLLMPLGDSALYQDTLMVVASPNEHYHVGGWYGMDIVGISTSKDTVWVKMTRNSFVSCNFEINTYTVNVVSNNIIRGMVESNGTQFAYGTPCTVTATAYTGYTFAGWSNGVTANPYTFAVVCDVELTALFVEEGEEVYTVTVESADPTMGTVDGGGQALSGGTLTIRAIPNEGYRFSHWNDGNTDNPRVVTVTENVTYTAYFESTTQGIHEADNNTITIYPNPTNGIVKIASDDVTRIDVYNVNGQLVKSVSKGSVVDISSLPSGVYTLRVMTVQSTFVCRVIKQ